MTNDWTPQEQWPQWLQDADTEGALVRVVSGHVHWHGGVWRGGVWRGGVWHDGVWLGGTWLGGTWHDGTWYGGTWRGGEWRGGEWRGGVWYNGTWRGGTWHDGTWCGGTWRGGTWRGGVWHDGTWYGGTWRGGEWRGGEWRGGEWRGGLSSVRSKYVPTWDGSRVHIGCKAKSIPEWDAWFAGDEQYETPRDTEAFRLIHAHYQAIRTWVVAMGWHAESAQVLKQSDPHCEFCEGPATWIAVPQECQPQYGCRLSCDRHRHWVRRLITMDVGSGVYVREYPGCDLCEGPVTADRLPPAYAVPVCHRCLPPPEPLPVADLYDERHSPGGESQVERLSDVDRQLCAIRARLECARQGYAVHVGCGGECTEDSSGGYPYTCQACGATVDWRSPDIAVPPAHDHYERDVSWLLSRLAEQEDCYLCPSPKIERHEDVPICRRCGSCHVQSHWQTERLRLVHDGGSAVSLEYFDRENDEWRIADDMDAKELRTLGSAVLAMADILEETEVCNG